MRQTRSGMDLPPSLCHVIQPYGQQAQNKSDYMKAGPREASECPSHGLWAFAWDYLALCHVGSSQSYSWGRTPLTGLFCDSQGLLIFGEFLKPSTDCGLNPGSATGLLADLGQVALS